MKSPIVLADPKERAAERAADTHWNDYLIKEIESDDGQSAVVMVGDGFFPGRPGYGGWTTMMPWPIEPRPKVGDKIRVWSNGSMNHGVSLIEKDRHAFQADPIHGEKPGLACPDCGQLFTVYYYRLHRGVSDNEHCPSLVPVYYQTKAERDAEHGAWIAEHQRKQRADFEKQRDELDYQFELLPDDLKRRIQRFRDEDPDFRWKEEAYEMASCAEAGRLYRAAMDPATGKVLKDAGIKLGDPSIPSYQQPKGIGVTDWEDTPENRLLAIDAINGAPNNYDYQLMERLFPWIDQGHSGNTWDHAVMFALRLVQGEGAKL